MLSFTSKCERVATCPRHGCLHTLAPFWHDPSRHLTYVLSSIQFLNMRHVTHTLHVHVALCAPPSCERAHAVRCRSCPLCTLYVTRLLSGFDLLFPDTRSERPSDVCYRIAVISLSSWVSILPLRGLPFVGWPAPRVSRLRLSCGCGVWITCLRLSPSLSLWVCERLS